MAHTQYPSMHRSKGHDNIDKEVDDYRSRRRAAKHDAEGAWVASLFLTAVALLMPLWFLATSVAFVNAELEAVGSAPMFARSTEIILLGLGTVATWFALRVAILLARAPRLGKGPHRQRLRIGSMIAACLALMFLERFANASTALAGSMLAYVGALAPAVLMVEISLALPAIVKRRYGTGIGSIGALAWAFASASLLLVVTIPEAWWLPTFFALCGSVCTAPAALRVWRHYEGGVVSAAH